MFLPRKKRRSKKIIFILLLLVLIAVFYYFYNFLPVDKNNSRIIEFKIEPGWGSVKISQELGKAGLIRNGLIFQLYVLFKGINLRLQDGNYFLAENMSVSKIADLLSRGASASKEITLTIIEGWNNQQIANYLAENGFSPPADFFAVVQKKEDWWKNYDFLKNKPKDLDLEGYLFPDTYRIYRDAELTDIIRKMLDNFSDKLNQDLRAEISRQKKTIHEVITLASIIEKEVATEKDRKLVADIFYKRLQQSIALQADSTVNYATGKSAARESADDIKIDNLYNTYRYGRLTPGPISNPGMSAIMAAIYPIPNPYWYFLTTLDGTVIYSKTFEEHVKAKAKYYK